MGQLFLERCDRKLDLAAHAAWLYYIASNTQEEISATKSSFFPAFLLNRVTHPMF
ncbi:MAG: hypothetical protein V7K33_05000 [Nostoc sp.]